MKIIQTKNHYLFFLLITLYFGFSNPSIIRAETDNDLDSSTKQQINTSDKTSTTSDVPTIDSTYETSSLSEKVMTDETHSKEDASLEEAVPYADVPGNGTASSPFLVASYSELTTVANTINNKTYFDSVNSDTVYINITQDLTSNGTRITFSSNRNPIIIDGLADQTATGNRYIYYEGSTSYAGLFALNTSDMNITFQNMNFGSTASPKSNYYGICYSTARSNSITVKNVNYYAEQGGQPFFATGANSTLNFDGNNTFIVSNLNSSNEEFAEIAGSINFKSNSKTAIVHKTNSTLSFVRMYSDIKINLEYNAQAFIQSGKQDMFYANNTVNLDMGERSKFTYLFDNNLSYIDLDTVFNDPEDYQKVNISGNTSASSNHFFNSSGNLNVIANKYVSLNFITENIPFQNGSMDINANDTANVTFSNNNPSSSALNNTRNSLKMTNGTFSNVIYNLKKTTTENPPSVTNEFILPTGSSAVMTSGFTNYNSLIYEPAVLFGGITASGMSGSSVSKIDSHLTGVSSILDDTYDYQTQYFISDDTDSILDDNTLNTSYTNAVLSPSNAALHTGGSIYTALNTLPSSSDTISDQATAISLDQLLPGDYRVYGRLMIISRSNGVTYSTPWKNTTTTIVPYQSVSLPKNIAINDSFKYGMTDKILGIIFNKNYKYTISNKSNQNIGVTPSEITPNIGNEVTIVPDGSNDLNEKELQLKLVSDPSSFFWDIGALSNPSNELELQPYWETNNNKKEFYLDGAYGGPYIIANPANLNYNLKFSVLPK